MTRADVVLVYKKSQLQLALEKKNERIQHLLKSRHVSVRPMKDAHDAHCETLLQVERMLKEAGCRVKKVYRGRLRPEHAQGRLLITVGGDGTLLDASHKVKDAPALGVNSDTTHSVGFLCAADIRSFGAFLGDILSGRLAPTRVQRLQGKVDGVALPFPVLNDLLMSHKNPAATSRYLVSCGDIVEDHKSSGLWVSTAAGSTAAMMSAGGEVQAIDDDRLQLRVREPFTADGPAMRLPAIFFRGGETVTLTSKMREGRIWLDGPHNEVNWPMGSQVTLDAGAPPLHLYTTPEMATRRQRARARTSGS